MWSESVRVLNPYEALATSEEKPKPKTNYEPKAIEAWIEWFKQSAE